jgi:hypothetical protein
MARKMSYRDYLVYEASSAAAALTEAITRALPMEDEATAVGMLEAALKNHTGLHPHPNPERVEERPRGADY